VKWIWVRCFHRRAFLEKMAIQTFRIGVRYSPRLEYGTIMCRTLVCDPFTGHEERLRPKVTLRLPVSSVVDSHTEELSC
jgi:hypothetical protein